MLMYDRQNQKPQLLEGVKAWTGTRGSVTVIMTTIWETSILFCSNVRIGKATCQSIINIIYYQSQINRKLFQSQIRKKLNVSLLFMYFFFISLLYSCWEPVLFCTVYCMMFELHILLTRSSYFIKSESDKVNTTLKRIHSCLNDKIPWRNQWKNEWGIKPELNYF